MNATARPPDRAVCLKSLRVMRACADALNTMAVHAEELGAELCSDPSVVREHLTALQTIDRLAQHLGQIAIVIAADDPVSAVDDVLLAELKDQLTRAA